MERERAEQEEEYHSVNVSRASTIGPQTSDHEHTENIIHEIVHYQGLDLIAFLHTCQQHPHLKDETKLIQEIFEKRQLIEDLIAFMLDPRPIIAKYGVEEQQARRLVVVVRNFLQENYEFYQHFFIKVEKTQLDYAPWFSFLDNLVDEVYHCSLAHLADVFMPYVKYEFSTSSRVTEYFESHSTSKSIMLIWQLGEPLLEKLLSFTHLEAIFKIIFHVVLASLQEQEWKLSLNLLRQLCHSSIEQGVTRDTHIENVHMMLKDVSNNIQKDIHNTIFAFTDAFVQIQLVQATVARVRQVFASSTSLQSIKMLEEHQEIILQVSFKVMAEVVNIYYLLRKIGIDYMAQQMIKLRGSILTIFTAADDIMLLLHEVQSNTIKFSNGQNIKPALLYRYEFLNLLRVCFTIVKECGECCSQLQSCIDKSLLIQFLVRCLSENRWNNIIHCLIEKVLCLAVGPEIFKGKGSPAQKLLKFLVETFSNKKYMFLNSAKMINQGDIHSLYFISRKLTVELDRTPGLVEISNEYDFWKQFVLNVLQKYQHKNERLSKTPTEMDFESSERVDGDLKVEIDELALIKEIVRKIDVNQKWSSKKEHSAERIISRAGSASSFNKPKIPHQKSEKMGSPLVHKTALGVKRLKSTSSDENKPEDSPQPRKNNTSKKIQSLPSNFDQIELKHACSSHSDSEAVDEEQSLKKIDSNS